MFKGTYRHRIDRKGRVPVPAAFRKGLVETGATGLVVTALDQCLAAYPPAEWQRLEAQLAALPSFSKPVKALTRLLASRATDCDLDTQGRILLPSALRAAAGLEDVAVMVGVLNRIELWSPAAWDHFLQESDRLLDDVGLDVQWPVPPLTPTTGVPQTPTSRPVRPQGKPSR